MSLNSEVINNPMSYINLTPLYTLNNIRPNNSSL